MCADMVATGTKTGNMEIHPLCGLFPLMSSAELAALKADIAAHGLREPITLHEGAIVDGRNRYRACEELGIVPRFEQWDGKGELLDFILSRNLHRRHLNESQRALVAARIANMRQGARTDLEPSANLPEVVSQSKAADLLNVSERSLRNAKVILTEAPDLVPAIEAGEMTVCQAKRKLDIQAQIESIGKLQPIEGLFDVIVVDPPWPYGGEYNEQGHRATSPYPEMQIEELQALKLPAAENCILWLWTTERFICEARELLEIWDFEYRGILVWDKQNMGMGNYLRRQCEFCWLGIKGKPIWRPTALRNIISSPRTAHSEKPEAFYEMIDKNFHGTKLDYFSRKKREGWTCYGAEVSLEQVKVG